MRKFPIVEKFVSINGEGTKAGELAVFIRFRGCNLQCSYCDTKWANTADCPAEMLTVEELLTYVQSTGVKNVTLTGGEPMLQAEIETLIDRLIQNGNTVEIETNGSIDLHSVSAMANRPTLTMDYKLPYCGMESKMNVTNFDILQPQDTVKFVVGSQADLERSLQIINEYHLTDKCHVYFSPVFGAIEPADIVSFMTEYRLNGVRLQLQLHKFIWNPNQRGV